MSLTKLRTLATTLMACVLLSAVSIPVAFAQSYASGTTVLEGEPTDPDEALDMLSHTDVNLDDFGLSETPPDDPNQAQTWFEQLLELLRNLGLLPSGE